MANIVSGLFGPTPEQVRQQQQMQMQAQAQSYAAADPMQRAQAGMFELGAGLANVGANMTGGVNPQVQSAQQEKALSQGIDFTNIDSIMKGSQRAAQAGNAPFAQKLADYARQIQEKEADNQFKQQQYAPKPQSYKEVVEPIGDGWMQKYVVDSQYNKIRKIGVPYKEEKGRYGGGGITVRDQIEVTKARDSGEVAENTGALLNEYEAALEQYPYEPGIGEDVKGTAARVGAAIGLGGNVAKAADSYREMDKISNKLGAEDLKMFGGSDTERELLVAIKTNPDPSSSRDVQKKVIQDKRRAMQVLAGRPQFMEQWISDVGGLNQKSPDGKTFTEAWKEYQKQQFKRTSVTQQPSAPGVESYDAEKEARYQAWKKTQGK